MKTSLEHLPQAKQEQILQIVEMIKKVIIAEKIILFGSYATGSWVNDHYIENGVQYEYKSDFDFLIVTGENIEKDFLVQDIIVNRSRHITQTPVNPLIHDINYVNGGLEIGQYFFSDIVEEGILLYDSNQTQFATPRDLSATEKKDISERYFTEWFESGNEFLIDSKNAFERNSLKQAAFYLHQVAERFYNTVLLVMTGYKPKTHNLDKLRKYSKNLSKEVFELFPYPTTDKYEANLFDLLKRGYVEARYKNDYTITKAEIEELIRRLERMKDIVKIVSMNKIESILS